MVDARALAQVIILNELMNSDDEKPIEGKENGGWKGEVVRDILTIL